jgi:hydrogenase/urease accessory protein HupE
MTFERTKDKVLTGSNFCFEGRARCPHRAVSDGRTSGRRRILLHAIQSATLWSAAVLCRFASMPEPRPISPCPSLLTIFSLLFCAIAWTAHAHTPDTSYCRIAITAHQVECKFSFDISTLQRITTLDSNNDGKLSRTELETAYPIIISFLRQHVYLDLNQRESEFADADPLIWPTDASSGIPKTEFGQRLINITFRNPMLSAPEDVTLTFDFFEQLGEAHAVLGAFVWNGHEDEVIFTRFEPDYLYDTGCVTPLADQLKQYFKLGVKHIFLGYDHIAFLMALLFVRRFADLLKIITAFTVAHTLTLALAVLQIIKLPPQLVEIGIAITIMYVAAENLWKNEFSHRWMLTFGFGLVHGFGFASVLRELGLPSAGLARSLLSFNLGVEAGQIVIVGLLWPVLWWLSRRETRAQVLSPSFSRPWSSRLRLSASVIIFLFGALWFCERTFAFKLLPI